MNLSKKRKKEVLEQVQKDLTSDVYKYFPKLRKQLGSICADLQKAVHTVNFELRKEDLRILVANEYLNWREVR